MCSGLKEFSEHYEGVHGYLSLVVCVLGTVLNLLNIAVLSRKVGLRFREGASRGPKQRRKIEGSKSSSNIIHYQKGCRLGPTGL